MKTICSLLLMTTLILSVAVFAVAREGPTDRQTAVTTEQVIAVQAQAPATTVSLGYCVICNHIFVMSVKAKSGLSTTVAERVRLLRTNDAAKPAPRIVLLA